MPDDSPSAHGGPDAALQRGIQSLPTELLLAIISWLTLSPKIDTLRISRAIYHQSIPHLDLYVHPPKLNRNNVESFYSRSSRWLLHRRDKNSYRMEDMDFGQQLVTVIDGLELDDYINLPPFLSKVFLLQQVDTLVIGDAIALAETDYVVSYHRSFVTWVHGRSFKTPRIKERLEAPLFRKVKDVIVDIGGEGENMSQEKDWGWATMLSLGDVFPKLQNVTLILPTNFDTENLAYTRIVEALRACRLQRLTIHGLPPDSWVTFSQDLGAWAAEVTIVYPS
ncbi:hypothetical protein L202_03275 [Cryptococcus amylolentus CBS 6039]|uniref:F-box domain-containing protein n=2 Tax=Cryptococcus amylolentus TaxID=104669 RepID=A0A1E3HUU1_9TREE|nr:hypothetical protein L202_03275 [Cryptococcus amylolentus CBS 6039]ODN79261.1 hypothetical protein L202_03275 [Cryptococcus amylolentus CBS 6039]ODO07667.1 hypothetical protein I350_03238 [Cryptococcus amylolentus CBS 6273]